MSNGSGYDPTSWTNDAVEPARPADRGSVPMTTDADLSWAVIGYLGFGNHLHPRAGRTVVVATYGAEVATAVEALVAEATAMNVDWSTKTLAQAERDVLAELGRRHPRLTVRAVAALVWRFAYDWR